jgi:electron transport complex protein RnfG
MKQIFPLALALTLIAAIAGLALSFVFDLTAEPIKEADLNKVRQSIIAVMPESFFIPEDDEDGMPEMVEVDEFQYYIGMDEAGTVIGVAVTAISPEGYGGNLATMVGILPNGNIKAIKNIKHLETPGLGSKIKDDAYKVQFIGASLDNKNFAVKKDGGDFDSITGATITSRAVTNSVRAALEHFKANVAKIILPVAEEIIEETIPEETEVPVGEEEANVMGGAK